MLWELELRDDFGLKALISLCEGFVYRRLSIGADFLRLGCDSLRLEPHSVILQLIELALLVVVCRRIFP